MDINVTHVFSTENEKKIQNLSQIIRREKLL